MSSVSFSAKIGLELAARLSDPKLKRLTNQDASSEPGSVNATVRDSVSRDAADEIEAALGSIGTFDDADHTVGDRAALRLGVRYAVWLLSQFYSLSLNESGEQMVAGIRADIEREAERRVQEASVPVIAEADDD